MTHFFQIFFLVTFGSVVSLALGLVLVWQQRLFQRLHLYLVAFAAGALIATALFDLLPEAMEGVEASGTSPETPFMWTAAAIAIFFVFEKSLHWYHDHTGHGPEGKVTKAVVPLITLGDGLHNFIDGALIAAATLASPQLGLLTAVAVFLHEIPQEVGDFSVLIFGGLSRGTAILYNLLSAAAAYLGAFATLILSSGATSSLTMPLVALTAGAFLFIALGELLPELIHKERRGARTVLLTATFIFAMVFMRYLGERLGV
ncbi:MAG TPA: ZIP family metal transporter [bacterium]|nr:ZIP family metal transporter [bacterium]